MAEIQILLEGIFRAEPVVQVTNLYELVDERNYLHVVLAPILVHVLDLDLYDLRSVLAHLWVLKLADQTLHYQL